MEMTVAQLQRAQWAPIQDIDGRLPTPRLPEGPERSGFGATLQDAIGRVDAAQKTSDAQIEAFVAGEQESLHEVMISINQARLYFQLMTEVRNRALETYQELMRMQV